MARLAKHLVGRADEVRSLERILDELERGRPGAVEMVGEPGIGKTRLLTELAMVARGRGHLVLSGSAAELEHDLPFSVFIDALDDYVDALEPGQIAALDHQVRAELAYIFPSLGAFAGDREVALQQERYRSHRAVRKLLELFGAAAPLVLVLDDVHWADSASVELIGALLRRPPAAAVLTVLAMRPRQTPERLAAALERALRDGGLSRIELGALNRSEARALLGEDLEPTEAAVLFEESGGNPFYLQQLARTLGLEDAAVSAAADLSLAIEVPSAVAAALTEEFGMLSKHARSVLQGAAVAGDPFDLDLAAAATGSSENATMDAIDELVRLDLVRETDLPRRFRFRHPLVRRAVYETTRAGWRLRAHERCAEALVAHGAAATARAYHVERSAPQGDLGAVAVLREAGREALRLAPESAADWFGAALRLLPQHAPAEDRVELLLARAEALAAAGLFTDSHEALLEATVIVPERAGILGTTLTLECARVEHRLGQYEQARARLVRALDLMPEASVESVELLVELAVNGFYRAEFESMHQWASRAVSAATSLGDAPLIAAASAMPVLADAMTGAAERAELHRAEAAALVDGLSDRELSQRLDAAAWLAAAELYLDRYPEADAHASRAFALAQATGQGELFLVLYQILGRVWYVRAKLAEATELLDGAIEASRLLGNAQTLAGNLFNRSVVALAVGDLDVAVATAQESAQLARDLDEGFVPAWAAVRLAGVLLETGEPDRAIELLLSSAGGEALTLIPGGWRSYGFELLTRCWLALDRLSEAQAAVVHAEATSRAVRLPLAAVWADRAAAAVALHAGEAAHAAEQALVSADAAREVGAPIEAALSRLLAGRAFAQDGQVDRAAAELQRAAEAFDACGALRYRDTVELELGKLGRRPHRRTRPGRSDGAGIRSLTERELQVARLVVDRKTNAEIAAELFLSKKTVETHLRNIFNKMGVPTRVALARAVELHGDQPR